MLLELNRIVKSFGGLRVLSGIDFYVDKGEIVGLIGPNGAGKTTLFNVISGVYQPDQGTLRYCGKDLIGLKPYQICRQGIARTFQLVRIFPTMTVLENVMVGAVYGNQKDKKEGKKEAIRCLKILDLADIKDSIAGSLTLSNRRLVEIARAMAANPGLALLDEPLAGLNQTEANKIVQLIHNIKEAHGISILWIEHKIEAVFALCDRIIVIEYGRKLADGTPDTVARNQKVMEAYLGQSPS